MTYLDFFKSRISNLFISAPLFSNAAPKASYQRFHSIPIWQLFPAARGSVFHRFLVPLRLDTYARACRRKMSMECAGMELFPRAYSRAQIASANTRCMVPDFSCGRNSCRWENLRVPILLAMDHAWNWHNRPF